MPSPTNASTPRARWGRALSLASLALAALAALILLAAPLGTWADLWTFRTGFGLLRWAVYAAVAAMGLGLLGGLLARGWARAAAAVVLALLVVAVPLYWLRVARSVPPIHDITTDTARPPDFEAVVPLRAGAANPPEYDPSVAPLQREAYPDVVPLEVSRPPGEVFEHARAAAEAMRWEVVAVDPARGRLEAVDTTFWFRFEDDIVVRVTPVETGTRVDVRSKSRIGRSDVGTNARRIRTYLADVARRAGG
jgi:uncharacterized protein (DUF1499 family)